MFDVLNWAVGPLHSLVYFPQRPQDVVICRKTQQLAYCPVHPASNFKQENFRFKYLLLNLPILKPLDCIQCAENSSIIKICRKKIKVFISLSIYIYTPTSSIPYLYFKIDKKTRDLQNESRRLPRGLRYLFNIPILISIPTHIIIDYFIFLLFKFSNRIP